MVGNVVTILTHSARVVCGGVDFPLARLNWFDDLHVTFLYDSRVQLASMSNDRCP